MNIEHLSKEKPPLCFFAAAQPLIDTLHAEGRTVLADNERLREALRKCYTELNVIRARDGVPRTFDGMKCDVDEAYFSSVVDEARAALSATERSDA